MAPNGMTCMTMNKRNQQTLRALVAASMVSAAALALAPAAHADQAGVPFWLSGQYPSLAAAPASPGWSLTVVPYDYSGSAGASKTFQIGPTIVGGLKTNATIVILQAAYAPETKILGGQLNLGLGFGLGYNHTTAAITLSNPPLAISRSQSVTGATDLYPTVSLAWNMGTSNWMVYGSGDAPVGAYNPKDLANVGIGHGAADLGGGYTYLDPTKGHEFTAVAGFTFNLENPQTHYTNGIDFHLDWAASQFLSEHWLVGVVGFVYDQVSGDSGSGDRVGSFESQVAAVGPQVGYLFAVAGRPAYINARGYWEFSAQHRVEGSAFIATLSFPLGPSLKK
jgi:hypothetical protein